MEVVKTFKDIVRRICLLKIINITLVMLRNLRAKVVPVVEILTLVPSNQICTVGNEIMDKNTKQSKAVKVRKAEGERRWRNKSSLVRI